jgi:hypothetical protein
MTEYTGNNIIKEVKNRSNCTFWVGYLIHNKGRIKILPPHHPPSSGGSLESDSWFCVDAFGRNWASAAMKMFSLLIQFVKKFYKFCTFSAICKDNSAINCITVQHKKG